MTFDQFHNGLRVLLNIDQDEFEAAVKHLWGPSLPRKKQWLSFRDNPYRWFIRAPDAKAKAIWKIVAERTKGAAL